MLVTTQNLAKIEQRRAWLLLGQVTAERSCPAIGGCSEVTFKPLVPRSPIAACNVNAQSNLITQNLRRLCLEHVNRNIMREEEVVTDVTRNIMGVKLNTDVACADRSYQH
ncbi:hypothetical protein J6590_072475 [Homalodisca vitripennis]|nr:hypothetical protein J6590_072475 [Homalodisca vitripennis]